MQLAFEELSVRLNGAGYGFFTGEAELDDFGDPVVIDLEATALGSANLKLDIAEMLRERVALRRKLGSAFMESEGLEVREHLKKWVLFHALSESLLLRYKEEIGDYLRDRWSSPQRHTA